MSAWLIHLFLAFKLQVNLQEVTMAKRRGTPSSPYVVRIKK
jgi:hypothetical protein